MPANDAPESVPWGAVLFAAILVGAVVPHLFVARPEAAREPFTYVPPFGFTLMDDAAMRALPNGAALKKAWSMKPVHDGSGYAPNITITHVPRDVGVEEIDLTELTHDFPAVFAASGVDWRELRHGRRVRSDGAHVGLVEGACMQGSFAFRSIQLVFPENSGTSIVTGSFPEDQADKLEAPFEASINDARGIAKRAGTVVTWHYFAWGIAGAILAYFGLALFTRGRAKRARGERVPSLAPIAATHATRVAESSEEPSRDGTPS